MTVLKANQPSFGNATFCHVCNKPVDFADFAVEHDGHVGVRNKETVVEGYGHIIMHAECATVLAMRLISDVMRQKERTEQTPLRVVEVLNKAREVNYGNA